ncbi:hypothetical protein [Streptomyces clavuligerus]|uniref:hypothetical protein n=1 Tax=Streptomyces clavuligerus TaxID=1901 RepID=UPI0012FF1E32|nr:hypothetical protein [Streptomyces clavuligerus]WDN55903.1 hypothetical protein LL058_28820 [Streptomyces clavuligerus]
MPSPSAAPEEPAALGSRIVVEAGDILMRRGLTDHAPAALVHVIEAAKALEDFRLGHSTALERAEILLDRAIATFRHGTGEHDEAAWQTAAVHMVELWATRYSPARLTVFDPAPPPPSRLTPAHPLRLETVSREAHRHLLDAGRCLERTACGLGPMDTARGQHHMHEAARLLHDRFDGLSMPLWVLICRFCAEIHAESLRILKAPAPGAAG